MRRHLTTLPVEIVLELAGHLNVADVAALARTARVLAQILSPSLYDIIIFNPAHPAVGQPLREKPGRYELSTVIGIWESEFVLNYFQAKLDAIFAVRDGRGRSPLHRLAATSNICLLDACLPGCGDIDVRDTLGKTPLHTAIQSGSAGAVLRLLDAGADILAQSYDGRSALSFLPRGFPEDVAQTVINAVLRAGGDVNLPDSGRRRIPLHYVALNGDEKLVNLLLAQGADVFALDRARHPPIVCAILSKQGMATRALLEAMKVHGYDVNGTKYIPFEHLDPDRGSQHDSNLRRSGETLLHTAVRTSKPEVVKVLLDFGANPTGFDASNRTPFDLAIGQSTEDVVKLISQNEYPPDFWPPTGYSSPALQMAFQIRVGCADAAIVRLLLELRRCGKVLLDLNHGELGVLPMLYACRIYRDGPEDAVPFIYDTVTSVVDAGADVNARDVHGKTALHLLCQSSAKHLPEALKLFSYLLGAGADWRLQDDLGNTALHDAATWGSDPIIKHILAVGAGDEALHYRNSHGETALHTALSEEYWYATIKSTKLLLDAGFCPNAVNHKGRSAAHLAALNRPWHEIGDFNSIVATNYNLRLKDNEGNPPFHYAVASRVPWGYPYTAGSLEETLRFYFNRVADLHDSCEECAAQRWRC